MGRKKWTAKTEVTDAVVKLREKRKWQIALRRYVLEQKWSAAYAPFFGVDIQRFRKWIELQFTEGLSWDNFSERWQFDHIVPVAYFDFGWEEDMRLCWNFTNIRVAAIAKAGDEVPPGERGETVNRGVDILGARAYFKNLFDRTGFTLCKDMYEKLEALEWSQQGKTGKQEAFLVDNLSHLKIISGFTEYEFAQLNEGVPMKIILEGRDFGEKYGDVS